MSNMPLLSPTTVYPGPPPPYSYPSSTASSAPALNGLISPPGSRRMSGDEKEPRSSRQSLPSIHEALAHASPPHFTFHVPSPISSQPPPPPVTASISSTSSIPRSHPSDASLHDRPIASALAEAPVLHPTQTPHPHSIQSQQPPHSSTDTRRISLPAITSQDHQLPNPYAMRTGPTATSPTSPLRPQTSQHPQSSPRYEPTPLPAGSMSTGFAYNRYHQSQYPYPPPPPPLHVVTAQSPYQAPPAPYSRQIYTARSDGSERVRTQDPPPPSSKAYAHSTTDSHGTSVKRHLEYFDVDASLRDIAESGSRLVDFSRDYRHRARDLQRSGPAPGTLPSVSECDEMLRHQQRIQDLLGRLREMVVGQEAALVSQHSQERPFKPPEDFEIEDPSVTTDEGKSNGTMSSEKRRRGRAAPPGRCHSCNRAETPEWRRGPDGARTLCNACGLHYAKLTRKSGLKGGSMAASAGSSLRPKSMSSGSPQT